MQRLDARRLFLVRRAPFTRDTSQLMARVFSTVHARILRMRACWKCFALTCERLLHRAASRVARRARLARRRRRTSRRCGSGSGLDSRATFSGASPLRSGSWRVSAFCTKSTLSCEPCVTPLQKLGAGAPSLESRCASLAEYGYGCWRRFAGVEPCLDAGVFLAHFGGSWSRESGRPRSDRVAWTGWWLCCCYALHPD